MRRRDEDDAGDDGDENGDDDGQFREFFRRLRDDPRVVRCGTVWIDVPGVVERKVACADSLCSPPGGVRASAGKSCCTAFRVPVDRPEIRRIERRLPEIRAIRDTGAAIDRAGGFWRRDPDDGDLWLNERPSGACVFLSAPRGEVPRCTLHEWALARGEDHRKVKPEICCLFPLYLVEWGDEVFVTSYGSPFWAEMEPEDADDVKPFACLSPPRGAGRSLFREQSGELRYRLGPRRFEAARRRLRALGHDV